MSAELELALLVLYAAVSLEVNGELEVDGEQVGVPTLNQRVAEGEGVDALDVAAAVARSDSLSPTDRVAVAQAFVLGVRYRGARDVEEPLHRLAKALLVSAGVDERAETQTGTLIGTLSRLSPEADLDEGARSVLVDELASAFGDALNVADVVPGSRVFSGPAAPTATLLYELATYGLLCRSDVDTIPVGGKMTEVTLVEVDVCTSLPFERCRRGIDPLCWPRYNPYFVSVDVVGNKALSPSGDGWAGVIKEKVGPAMNGTVYETDLAVRYLEQTRLAAVAFKLADFRNDDDRVTVDDGFVSVTDEGTHRRMRVLKVYGIKDLHTPPGFVCPLWAWQVVLSGWLVPAPAAMVRLLRAWVWLANDAVTAGRGLYDYLHGRKDPEEAEETGPGPVRVARGSEHFTIMLGGACKPAHTGEGKVRVGVQRSTVKGPLQKVNVRHVEPGRIQMPKAQDPAAKPPLLQPHQDFVDVAIDDVPPWGLYSGRVQDAGGRVDSPFLIYLDGLP